MPFNGAGVYTPPGADFPAVANTLIQSTKFNNVVNDIATGLTTCLTKDGQTTPTANIPMGTYRLTGLGAPSATGDALSEGRAIGAATPAAITGTTGTFTSLVDISGAAAGQVKFPATQNASSNANTLDDYLESSYTATLTGGSTAPTGTVTYTKVGNSVVFQVPAFTATSNATSKTLTGMPAGIRPLTQKRFYSLWAQDNSGAFTVGSITVETSGVMNLFYNGENAWTASGTFTMRTVGSAYTLA